MIRPTIRPVVRPMIRRAISLVAAGLLAALVLTVSPSAGGAQPSGEPAYADGDTYLMHSPHLITGATGGLLNAPPMYVLAFTPPAGSATGQPITVGDSYHPQCNPCLQEPVPYHDHLLTGEPGSGTNGTAGDYAAPWRIVIMHYNPAYSNSPDFVPLTSDTQLAAYEAAGDFLPINNDPNAPDPYEVWTDNVLICPLVKAG